jgi:hypothetical protein
MGSFWFFLVCAGTWNYLVRYIGEKKKVLPLLGRDFIILVLASSHMDSLDLSSILYLPFVLNCFPTIVRKFWCFLRLIFILNYRNGGFTVFMKDIIQFLHCAYFEHFDLQVSAKYYRTCIPTNNWKLRQMLEQISLWVVYKLTWFLGIDTFLFKELPFATSWLKRTYFTSMRVMENYKSTHQKCRWIVFNDCLVQHPRYFLKKLWTMYHFLHCKCCDCVKSFISHYNDESSWIFDKGNIIGRTICISKVRIIFPTTAW